MLYVVSKRHTNFEKSLELGLDCLQEYEKFTESKEINECLLIDVIDRFRILERIAEAYFNLKKYREAFQYWNQTIDDYTKNNNYSKEKNESLFNVFCKTIKTAFKYFDKVDETQMYINKILTILTLSEYQANIIIKWQSKCMNRYLATCNTSKIIQYHEQMLKLTDMCKVSDHKLFTQYIFGYLTVAHYYQGNFGLGIESGLKGLNPNYMHPNYKLNIRYLGKCFLRMKKFESAFEYFSMYPDQKNCTILLEFALLYLEPDSNYFSIETAKQFYLEALEKKVLDSSFDQKETLELLEKRFKNHKRSRSE
jgi:tetratricopeptide (TPR) repeat protein